MTVFGTTEDWILHIDSQGEDLCVIELIILCMKYDKLKKISLICILFEIAYHFGIFKFESIHILIISNISSSLYRLWG